jgi:hypothetical protein
MEMDVRQPHVVAIGGVGGSGTRVGAALLQMLGYYIGDDLNEPLDNLWFTLLFKRRSVLLENETDFRRLVSLFRTRMSGRINVSDAHIVERLVRNDRQQHSKDWLRQRAASFLRGDTSRQDGQPWGWKEPNTHIVIERMFEFELELRYIHFVRHPIDMALSENQNQLENWGPIVLDHDVAIDPRQSLAYWCAVHRRVASFLRRWPERIMILDFDALCDNPDSYCIEIASFLGTKLSNDVQANFRAFVEGGRPSGPRFKKADLGKFDPLDLKYVAELGYDIS